MGTESDQSPDHIGARIEQLLAELPADDGEPIGLPTQAGLEELARRLGEAHELLVQALESVEKG